MESKVLFYDPEKAIIKNIQEMREELVEKCRLEVGYMLIKPVYFRTGRTLNGEDLESSDMVAMTKNGIEKFIAARWSLMNHTYIRVIENHEPEDQRTGGAKGVILDVQTANVLITIWDNLRSPKSKESFKSMNLGSAVDTAWKVLAKCKKDRPKSPKGDN